MMFRPISRELYRNFYVLPSTSPDAFALVPWPVIRIFPRGRWDDIDDRFRTFYGAGDVVTTFVEVLQSFRPSRETCDGIAAIEDPDDSTTADGLYEKMQFGALAAARDHLEPRYVARYQTTGEPELFDVLSGEARGRIESRFPSAERLKTGAFSLVKYHFTRTVARFVFDNYSVVGVHSRSAEHGDGTVLALFEDDKLNGKLRIGDAIWVESIDRATAPMYDEAATAALRYLDIIPTPSTGAIKVVKGSVDPS
jgi:hypothetical protein